MIPQKWMEQIAEISQKNAGRMDIYTDPFDCSEKPLSIARLAILYMRDMKAEGMPEDDLEGPLMDFLGEYCDGKVKIGPPSELWPNGRFITSQSLLKMLTELL